MTNQLRAERHSRGEERQRWEEEWQRREEEVVQERQSWEKEKQELEEQSGDYCKGRMKRHPFPKSIRHWRCFTSKRKNSSEIAAKGSRH